MAEKEVKIIKKKGVEDEVVIDADAPQPQANIAFIGEEPWKPLVNVQTATGHFRISEDQTKPFYHKEAGFLIRTYPHLYKPVKAKGDK